MNLSDPLITTIIPNWLTAIGTVSAVVISLYLSTRDRRFKYYSKANFCDIIFTNQEPIPVFMINIINESIRPIKITSITWITKNYFKTVHYFQMPDENPYTDILPKTLEDGQELKLYFDADYFKKGIKSFKYKNVKLFFTTSTNDQYRISITKDAIKEIKLLITNN